MNIFRRLLGHMVHRPKPWPDCPATQSVHKARDEQYRAVHRMLLAETGKRLPAVEKLVEAAP